MCKDKQEECYEQRRTAATRRGTKTSAGQYSCDGFVNEMREGGRKGGRQAGREGMNE